MVAFVTRMGQGNPGDITRQSQATIEAQIADSANVFGAYGLPGKIGGTGGNKFIPFSGGEAATVLYGILVKPYPTQGVNASDPLGTAVPKTTGQLDVLKRGYLSVKVNNGTPSQTSGVFIRVATPSGAKVIGGFEAVADGGNTVQITNANFTGAADANGNAELAFNL